MLGTVVIGAVAASWISITTPLVLPGDISLQKDVLDTIFPKILPLGTVMLCYWLMSKKKMGADDRYARAGRHRAGRRADRIL